jgi:hypothetical protein
MPRKIEIEKKEEWRIISEKIPITVSQRAPDKEARPIPYHGCS